MELIKLVPLTLLMTPLLCAAQQSHHQTCEKSSSTNECYEKSSLFVPKRRYILYNVNQGEGFNLRRDVYMRIASLVHILRQSDADTDWILVLPPWGPLYHWKSESAEDIQAKLPWKQFFDLDSLSLYVPVIEFDSFLENGNEVDVVFYLQHYPDTFTNNEWVEKANVAKCLQKPHYVKAMADKQESSKSRFSQLFWGYDDVFTREVKCLSIQGRVSTLHTFLKTVKSKSIMIDKAETILHDAFGDANYWNVRRSMRFSKHLVEAADRFREKYLHSVDIEDNTVMPKSWKDTENVRRNAIGGPYIAVHLRRQDYIWARPSAVPELSHAIKQILKIIDNTNLTTVFVATDGSKEEFNTIKKEIKGAVRFYPTTKEFNSYLDGGVAIIDQWICAHSRFFIGSFESTFSFRIQEEREILGFKPETTFNCFCGDNKFECQQPTRWKIVI